MFSGNAGQRYFVGKLVVTYFHTHGAEAYFFGSIADAKQRNALAGDVAVLAQQSQVVLPAMVLANHVKAGRAAVAGIELGDVGEPIAHTLMINSLQIII